MDMDKLLGIFVVILVGVSLLPTIVSSWTAVDLSNITIGTTVYDLGWTQYLGILFFVLGVALIGVVLVQRGKK